MTKVVPFSPMANGGCPQCTWVEDNLGVHLLQECALHGRIMDLQDDLGWERDTRRGLQAELDGLLRILGIDLEDDHGQIAGEIEEQLEYLVKLKARIDELDLWDALGEI